MQTYISYQPMTYWYRAESANFKTPAFCIEYNLEFII